LLFRQHFYHGHDWCSFLPSHTAMVAFILTWHILFFLFQIEKRYCVQ
jgi:hypothetical protein